MDTIPTTSYLSLRVDVPLRTALAAFDNLLYAPNFAEQTRFIVSTSGVWRVPVPRAPSYLAYRRAQGVLVAGRIRRPVHLELAPWSSAITEIGLRPGGRVSRSLPDVYFDHGHRLLSHVRQLIRCWADEPLRTMTATTETLTRCYLLVQADPGMAGDVVRRAMALPAVADATATTGSYDVFVHAAGDDRDIRELPDALRRLPGVSRVLVCLSKY
jgi:hypothetical protein